MTFLSSGFVFVPIALFVASPLAARSQDEKGTAVSHGEESVDSPKVSLSEDAKQTMERFEIAEGFHAELYASEPLLANPVAFCFDVLGRIYVAETFRHSKGVTDIRSHMNWLEDDLAIKTVEDRVAMFRKHEGDEGLEAGYAIETDRVTRVEDTDGDGIADSATPFAEGFTDPAVGIGAGVMARPLNDKGGVDVWFTCIPDVWRLTDQDGDGAAESRESQSYGYGLRVALLGHDLHGLVIGPDGRMYFSIGDRGFNVKTAEGKKLVRYGMGATFRCELDGSDLEIFCDGLRNPQELSFDDYGNLFTLDNNSDGGDMARWTWLLQGSDSGWRQAYQWVGAPTSRGPWNEELMWKPYHAGQPAFILPPIANFTSGPSGLVSYPGTGFGEDWRGRFFICDFRGAPKASGIYAFTNERDRAGFRVTPEERFVWNGLPTDVDFGLDGNLYWSDWVTGWNQTGKGRIYRVVPDGRTAEESAAIADTAATLRRLAAEGGAATGSVEGRESALLAASGFSDEELVGLFSHRDRRVRQEAQLALAHRALAEDVPRDSYDHLVPALKKLRAPSDGERGRVARLHCAWTLWHVSRRSDSLGMDLPKYFTQLLYDQDPEVCAQAARVLGDLQWEPASDRIPSLLIHDEPRVRLFAAQALGGIGVIETSMGPLMELIETSTGEDPWLRHAAIHAVERLGSPGDVHAALGHESVDVRRAMAVVLRRWKDDAIAVLLADADASIRAEAARAIYDARIEGAMDDLAAFLESAPADATDHLTWRRALWACREDASAESVARIVRFAASQRGPATVRAEAIGLLTDFAKPLTRDGILLDHRPLPGGDASAIRSLASEGLFAPSFVHAALGSGEAVREFESALVNLHSSLQLEDVSVASLLAVARSSAASDAARGRAMEALLSSYSSTEDVARLVSESLAEVGSPLRTTAFMALPVGEAASKLEAAALLAKENADSSGCADAVRILGSLSGQEADAAFVRVGQELLKGMEPAMVEWLEAAAKRSDDATRTQLAGAEALFTERLEADPLAAWRMCLAGGDVAAGRVVFETKSETNCVKCHAVGALQGSEAGPALDLVSSRLDEDSLLRSIVAPNAEIAEGFQNWIFVDTDDEIYSGRIVEETAELVVLETSKKEQLEFAPDEIRARKRDVSAMPGDMATHLSRREMRDLLAYLKTLKGTADPR